MSLAPDHFSRRHLAAWVLFITACIIGLVVVQHATRWRGGAGEHDDGPPMQLVSQTQSERCLTAHGLRVASAGARSLHVTGPSHIDVTLTFYRTFDQAQAATDGWFRAGHGPQRVTRGGARGGAMDTVAWRGPFLLDDRKFRLFSSCVGHQPVRPSA